MGQGETEQGVMVPGRMQVLANQFARKPYHVIGVQESRSLTGSELPVENNIVYGVPYFRRAGAEHNVVNRSNIAVAFMEIEIK